MNKCIKVAHYSYNELGQVIKKNLGLVTGTTYLQNVDMRYNIRGQLLSINNSKLTSDGGMKNGDSNDVFGMELLYDQSDGNLANGSGNAARFDGRLTAVKWMSVDASGTKSYERSYTYAYDDVNRYTGSTYSERTTTGTGSFSNNLNGFDESGIMYDAGGNITFLNRNSSTQGTNSHTQIDALTYTYSSTNPNQLTSVSDAGTSAGFAGGSGTYTYDANGNLTNEPYKGIATIAYNDLNRTDKITFSSSSNKYIDYTYDANGSLIRKRQYDNVGGVATLQNTTDYVDGFVYVNSTLSYFPMPEGRVVYNSGAFNQEFIITDQQGNARVSFWNNGSGVAIVKQENSYYGFGMQLANSPVTPPATPNKRLYNGGSEWQNDYTGNLPDYYQTFNRNYDAALGRFIGVDPMAESAESITSYQYAGNNPILFNDPLGDLLPMPGSHTPPPYQNIGGGSNLPADIQASVDAFYASADGGAYGADPGLTQYNVMTGDLGSYGVDQIDMTSIYHAGNKATGDPSTGSLAAAVVLLNNISVANGGAPLSKYNTSWVYLSADGSILHQDVGEGSGGIHYYGATTGELGGQTVYTVNGEIANQGRLGQNGWPIGFFVEPSSIKLQLINAGFGYYYQGNINNINILAYDNSNSVSKSVLVHIPTLGVEIPAISFGHIAYEHDVINNLAKAIEYAGQKVFDLLSNGRIYNTTGANDAFMHYFNSFIGGLYTGGGGLETPMIGAPSSNLVWSIFPWKLK